MATNPKYVITEIEEWPEAVPATKQAVLDFLASGAKMSMINGEKDFLVNVRRAVRSDEKLDAQVTLMMRDGRLFIKRKEDA